MKYAYDFPRPALTADLLLFRTAEDGFPEVLLIERGNEPFQGKWAIPGGFVEEGEDLEQAARREGLEEVGTVPEKLVQFRSYGRPGRDPRGWVVTVLFLGFLRPDHPPPEAGDDAKRLRWFPLRDLPPLAFDHAEIMADVRTALSGKPGF